MKEIVQRKQQNTPYFDNLALKKRLKTEGVDERSRHEISYDFNRKNSKKIQEMQDTFWKKKSMNSKSREYTTDARSLNNRYKMCYNSF